MNWTKLSAVAELLSSVAIVVTLVYLAVQTRQNTEAIQANGRQTTASLEMELLLNQADHPEIWARQHLENLSDVELTHMNSWMVAFFRMRELDWFNYRNGVIGEDEWTSYRQSIHSVLSTDRARVWWSNMSRNYSPGFAALVTETIKETPTIQTNNILDAFK